MCSTIYTDCRYDNCFLYRIGSVHCLNQMCSAKLCMRKRLFNLSAEATTNVLNTRPCVKCAIFVLRNKQIRFSWGVNKWFIFFGRIEIQRRNSKKFKSSCWCRKLSIVPAGIVQDNSVSMSIHRQRILEVATKVCNAKRATTIWRILSNIKNQHSCCLVAMGQFVSPKRRIATSKLKNHLPFWRCFSNHHNRPHPNVCQKRQRPFHLWHCRRLIGWYVWLKIVSQSNFKLLQSTVMQHDIISLQRWYWVLSRLWCRFSYSQCKRSCPSKDNNFPRNTSANVELVVVS